MAPLYCMLDDMAPCLVLLVPAAQITRELKHTGAGILSMVSTLCCAALCHAGLCRAMLRCAMLGHAVQCYAVLCTAVLCRGFGNGLMHAMYSMF